MKHINISCKSLFLLFASLSFFLVACQSSDGESVSATVSQNDKSVKSAIRPCEIITLEDIKDHFQIQASLEVEVSDDNVTFPACSYEWGIDLVMGQVTAGGKTVEYGSPATVMIVVAQNIPPSGFEQSTSVYKDAEEVSGIGDKAVWGAKMSQLTFLIKNTLFHVNVKASPDEEKNKNDAIALSKLIIKKV
ncbi:MAG: hypothetical protein ABI123_07310 [Ginsengibacter sp.]